MAKWKCRECGESVEAGERPPHCPNVHEDIKKKHAPLEWIMHKLHYMM
jgi:ABC-type ATPase with predicted acetyltransferase domain